MRLAPLLLLAACAGPARLSWSAYGAEHWNAPADASHTEHEVLCHLVVDCGVPMDKAQAALRAAEVHWVSAPWTGPDGEQWEGVTDGRVIRVANERAYAHELRHLVGAYVYAYPDAAHRHPCWWR